ERRPRLARRPGHVDVAAVRGIAVRRAADPRNDAARAWLDRHERRIGRVAIAEGGEAQAHEALRLRLETRVERGLDHETVAAGEVRTQPRELGAGARDEMVRDRRAARPKERDGLR